MRKDEGREATLVSRDQLFRWRVHRPPKPPFSCLIKRSAEMGDESPKTLGQEKIWLGPRASSRPRMRTSQFFVCRSSIWMMVTDWWLNRRLSTQAVHGVSR